MQSNVWRPPVRTEAHTPLGDWKNGVQHMSIHLGATISIHLLHGHISMKSSSGVVVLWYRPGQTRSKPCLNFMREGLVTRERTVLKGHVVRKAGWGKHKRKMIFFPVKRWPVSQWRGHKASQSLNLPRLCSHSWSQGRLRSKASVKKGANYRTYRTVPCTSKTHPKCL